MRAWWRWPGKYSCSGSNLLKQIKLLNICINMLTYYSNSHLKNSTVCLGLGLVDTLADLGLKPFNATQLETLSDAQRICFMA